MNNDNAKRLAYKMAAELLQSSIQARNWQLAPRELATAKNLYQSGFQPELSPLIEALVRAQIADMLDVSEAEKAFLLDMGLRNAQQQALPDFETWLALHRNIEAQKKAVDSVLDEFQKSLAEAQKRKKEQAELSPEERLEREKLRKEIENEALSRHPHQKTEEDNKH